MKTDIFLSLAESSSLLYFIYNPALEKFTYLNPSCRSFFEVDENNDLGSPLLEAFLPLIHRDDKNYLLERFEDLANEPIDGVECRFRKKDEEGALLISAYLLNDNGETVIAGHADDITIRKEHTQVILKHNTKKNTILNVLRHDLAGPIGIIGNLAELVKNAASVYGDQKISLQLDKINEISNSCVHMIQNFLNEEFLQSAVTPLLKRRVDLVKVLAELVQEYSEIQKERGIQFVWHTNKDIIFANIDQDKFIQVIHNLISNAMKFTNEGGEIKVGVLEKPDTVQITIADTGIGIPEIHHASLFEAHSRAGRRGLRGEESTGLGMSIIKAIIEWHDGLINFESKEHIGTTFYIEIPKN